MSIEIDQSGKDEEYTGKNEVIKETLEKLLLKRNGDKWTPTIRFAQIGKHLSASLSAFTARVRFMLDN